MRSIRLVLWGLVAAALIAGGGLYLFYGDRLGEQLQATGTPEIGGDFTLVNGDGQTMTQDDFLGRPLAVFFGFTHCPDVCPTSLFEMTTWIEKLGEDAENMRFAFVSVDPERDTPEVMRDYVGSFSDVIIPLTGSREQIDEVMKAYRVYAQRVELDDGDYTMDHSAFVYLMDAEGVMHDFVNFGASEEEAMEKLRALLAASAATS